MGTQGVPIAPPTALFLYFCCVCLDGLLGHEFQSLAGTRINIDFNVGPFWMPPATRKQQKMSIQVQQAKTLTLHQLLHFSLFSPTRRQQKNGMPVSINTYMA